MVTASATLEAEQLPAEQLTDENSTQPKEISNTEINTCKTQIAGVSQDLDAIELSAEFDKEDLHAPDDDETDNSFNLKSVDLSDVCNEENTIVDADSTLQELITNSASGEWNS